MRVQSNMRRHGTREAGKRNARKRGHCARCGYELELHVRAFSNSRDKRPAARLCRMEYGYEVRGPGGPEVVYPGRVKLMRIKDEDIIRPVARPDHREYVRARRRLARGKLDGRGDVVVDENITAKLQLPLDHDKRRKLLLDDRAGDDGRKVLARGAGNAGAGVTGYPQTVAGWRSWRPVHEEEGAEPEPRRARPFGRKGSRRYRQNTR